MGCLNSGLGFKHWFGNIHLSGPCNRSCYFCIGQHMMALDSLNTLDSERLPGMEEFVERCHKHRVREVFLTGTNTDPVLYRHHESLTRFLHRQGFTVGIRTNGAHASMLRVLEHYDKASMSICSLDPVINEAMMGGPPPTILDVELAMGSVLDFKVNIPYGKENAKDLAMTITRLAYAGVRRINVRELYGQPHLGDPFAPAGAFCKDIVHGMPVYDVFGCTVTFWDVHYCQVESINLYANGRISEDYPITRGHDDAGIVLPQKVWGHGRHKEQWLQATKDTP